MAAVQTVAKWSVLIAGVILSGAALGFLTGATVGAIGEPSSTILFIGLFSLGVFLWLAVTL